MAEDLGVLTVSVPLFQSASARSKSLWKQTVEMSEGRGDRWINSKTHMSTDRVKNKKHTKKEKSVKEIREMAE